MRIVTIRACHSLAALDEALRIAESHHLARNEQFFRQGIGAFRKSDVTLGAGFQAPIRSQLLGIDNTCAGLAVANRFDVHQTRSVAALT